MKAEVKGEVMAQGKLKVKNKLPNNIKAHSIHRGVNAKHRSITKGFISLAIYYFMQFFECLIVM